MGAHARDDLIIDLRGVEKRFDGRTAVRDMTLAVPRGATYGLLGPNGAGKTTTIRIVLGILEASAGSVRVFGEPVTQRSLDRIGYLPEERGLYRRMTVRRVLSFLAELKGMRARDAQPRIDAWLERLGLSDRADARVQELSKGMQQKIQFISAILHDPELVILDEPFSGLDPINQQVLKEIVVDLQAAGQTILFCTHMIQQAERTCDHVCIIARGQKVLDGSISDVKRSAEGHTIALGVDSWNSAALALLQSHETIARLRTDGNEAEIMLKPTARDTDLLRDLVSTSLPIRRYERMEPSLEQIFLERAGPLASADDVESQHV